MIGVTSHLKEDRLRVGGGYVLRMEPAEVAVSECKVVLDESVGAAELDAVERLYADAAWSLQPCMDAAYDAHLARALALVTERPRWRLSLQLHKIVGVP